MDNSCPATPLILTEAEAKTPLRLVPSSPDSDGMKSPSRDSPDSHCVICLGKLKNKSFTDSCLHQFCFQCLLQWSKVKAECPLCKQPFKSIIHNVRSNLDYDQYHVEPGEPHCVLSNFVHSFNLDFIQVDRRFRYRSTMTRDYFRELAESLLARNNLINTDYYQIPPMVPVDPSSGQNVRMSNRFHNSVRHRGTTEFRRNIYTRDLWVQDLQDISGRYRECSPQFYRDNPAQVHRIVPWLNREVNVLLSENESQSAYILTRIISYLSQYPIRSREFKELVRPYFGSRTDHFIHEFYTFAHSVYDIAGFDQHAVYGPNPNYATEVQEISSSNEGDSDIEIIETIKCKSGKRKKSSKKGCKDGSMKKAKHQRTFDEPVAGPSGISSNVSSEPFEIYESDQDEVKVLDYVKPQPELVVLSSDEDCSQTRTGSVCKSECVEVLSESNDKSSQSRLSHNDDYLSDSEKEKNQYDCRKGKCKSNGHGLKGKQKQKYIKCKKSRSVSVESAGSSSSFDSISSSSTSSSSSSRSSSTSSRTSRHKSKRRRSNGNRKKSKKVVKHSKLSHRLSVVFGKRRKSIGSRCQNSNNGGEETHSGVKKRVKSCVIVPETTLHREQTSSSTSTKCEKNKKDETRTFNRNPHYPRSYWSMIPGREKEWSRRKRNERSGEEKIGRHSNSLAIDYSTDES